MASNDEHAEQLEKLKRDKELADAEKEALESKNALNELKEKTEAQKALDELKKKAAAEDEKKALAEKEKARIDAERALELAKKQSEALQEKIAAAKTEKEFSDARKAAADAAKSEADASKAKSEAEFAALKARVGEVPTSPYKGDVTLKENAGKMETLLLAAQAARSAAAIIAGKVRSNAADSKAIVLIASSDVPTFDNLLRYNVECDIVEKALKEMERISADANKNDETLRGSLPSRPSANFAAPIVVGLLARLAEKIPSAATVGVALDAADKLLGFFRTDYTAGGIDVTLEDATLINELAGLLARKPENGEELVTVYLPKVFNWQALETAATEISKKLQDMALSRAAGPFIAAAHDRKAVLWLEYAAHETDEKKKETIVDAVEAHKKASETIAKTTALYDSWFARLSSMDEKSSIVPIVAVIREQALKTALNGGKDLLAVKVHAASGGYYTKKNICTTLFGAIPFFHTGGTVASFTLLNGQTGAVKAAGTVPVHGGFFSSNKLARKFAKPPDLKQ
jgi:hypothetical protein